MAITATAVIDNPNYKSWDITALDADTTTSFSHGFVVSHTLTKVAPDMVVVTAAISEGTTDTSTWGVTWDATNITLTKQNATGSGTGLGNVAKVFALRPHSIMQ